DDVLESSFLQNRSQLITGLAFWQHAFSPRTTGQLRAGVRFLDSKSDVKDKAFFRGIFGNIICLAPAPNYCFVSNSEDNSDSGTVVVAAPTLSHAYPDGGQVDLTYLHETRRGTASSTGTSAIDVDTFSVSLSHRLSQQLTLSLSGTYLTFENTSQSKAAV